MTFEEGDSRDPANFTYARKWAITLTASFFSLITGLSDPRPFAECISDVIPIASSSGAYALGFASMTQDLRTISFQATVGMSTYTLGFAVVPLVTSSFSEEFGRQPLYLVSAIGCLLMHVMTAL